MKHEGLNQLICAAVVNEGFREALLSNPAKAIARGYFDHSFSLTVEERDMVLDIRAHRIEDFAAQVHRWISGNGRSIGHPRNNGQIRGSNGHKQDSLNAQEPFVDLYRAPALA